MGSPSVGYWRERARRQGIAPFGQSLLGEWYNRGLFRAKERALASSLRAERLPPPSRRRCLDAGVGHGWLLERWARQGVATLAGIEAVEEVAARASRKVPLARIRVADLASWRPEAGEGYDLVCALDVLFYLTDEAEFERALAALASSVAPGGVLVLSDTFGVRPSGGAEVRNRPWADYARVLGPLGLAPRRRRSLFALANRPCPREAGGTLWQNALFPRVERLLWNLAVARSPLARPLEAAALLALYGLDALLLAQGGRWGSQEIAVWRRLDSRGGGEGASSR